MQALFTDEFDRIVSPPGNGWAVNQGTWSCDGSRLRTTGSAWNTLMLNAASGYPNQQVRTPLDIGTPSGRVIGHILRSNADRSQRVQVDLDWNDNPALTTVEVFWHAGGVYATRGIWHPNVARADGLVFESAVIDDTVYCWLNGVLVGSVSGCPVASGAYVGLSANYANNYIESFTLYDATAAVLTCDPLEVPALSTGNLLTLGTNLGGWTPGVPGVPVFTFDGGVVSQQWVDDEWTAHVVYDAPADVGTVRIDDPVTGAAANLNIGSATTPDVSAILSRLGVPDVGETLVSYLKTITGGRALNTPSVSFERFGEMLLSLDLSLGPAAIAAEFRTATASSESRESSIASTSIWTAALVASLQNAILEIGTDLNAIRGQGNDTLRAVIDELSGTYGDSLADIRDLIDGLQFDAEVNLQPVLDAIAALRGDNSTTLQNVHADLGTILGIKGLSNRDLTQVWNRIDAAETNLTGEHHQTHDSQTALYDQTEDHAHEILSAISGISNGGGTNLWDYLTSLLAALDLAKGGVGTALDKLQVALDALSAIASLLKPGGHTQYAPPVWPGAANVLWNQAYPLAVGLSVPVLCDGVVIEVTGVPNHTPHYDFGGTISHNHVGAIAFINDAGFCEPPQNFGWERGLYLPKTMTRASAFVLRCKAGVRGTLTPWAIKPSLT